MVVARTTRWPSRTEKAPGVLWFRPGESMLHTGFHSDCAPSLVKLVGDGLLHEVHSSGISVALPVLGCVQELCPCGLSSPMLRDCLEGGDKLAGVG